MPLTSKEILKKSEELTEALRLKCLEEDNGNLIPAVPFNPAPVDPVPDDLFPINLRGPISFSRDKQPATPKLPDIGEFIEMPGTGGTIEVTRITPPFDGDNALAHNYARRFSIDPFNKYILLNSQVHDLDTFKFVERPPLGYEYVPSYTEEDVFYGITNERKLQSWNVKTNLVSDIFEIPETHSKLTIGQWKGQQDYDDRMIPLVWRNQNSQTMLATLDLFTGITTGVTQGFNIDGTAVNHMDVSARGTYVIVGTKGGVYRCSLDFQDKIRLDTPHGSAHVDMTLDMLNREVMVQEGNRWKGDIVYFDLETTARYDLDVVDTEDQQPNVSFPNAAAHISGQAQTGQALVSLQHATGLAAMFTVDLKPANNQVRFWGHSFTSGNQYIDQAKASINIGGDMVVFSSNWMSNKTYEFLARVK